MERSSPRRSGVARITLNRPDRLNSFTRAMHGELARGPRQSRRRPRRRPDRRRAGFCAGQDLNDRAVAQGGPTDIGEAVEACWNPLAARLATLPQPMIARVNGVAAGAGASIAFACDIVVAARSAKFIQSFAALGLIPDTGGAGTFRASPGRRARSASR